MKILVPTDFSPDALQALRYAIEVAKLLQSQEESPPLELLIYHAFHVPIGGDGNFFTTSAMIEREEQVTRKKVGEVTDTIPELQSMPFRIITSLSMPSDGIKKVVEEEEVDLVMIGVKGAGAASFWLGSTTLQVMRSVHCPVLAVPRTTEVFHPKHIAFATDLEKSGGSSYLDVFKQLVKLWQATVHFIHVHPNPAQARIAQAQEALNLDQFLKDSPHTYHFVEDRLATRGIEQHLMRYPTDLLVVIPRHRAALESLFHKSVTKQLAELAPLPILSIREKNEKE